MLEAGHGRHLFEGPDDNLWRQMYEAGVPKLTWVPSHKSAEVAQARCVPYEHWFGNGKADKAAKTRALAREPPPRLMRAHRRKLFLLTKCLAVIAKVQEAVVSRDNAPGVFLAKHKKLRVDKVPHGANKRLGRPEVALPDELPDGVHELAVPFLRP